MVPRDDDDDDNDSFAVSPFWPPAAGMLSVARLIAASGAELCN